MRLVYQGSWENGMAEFQLLDGAGAGANFSVHPGVDVLARAREVEAAFAAAGKDKKSFELPEAELEAMQRRYLACRSDPPLPGRHRPGN